MRYRRNLRRSLALFGSAAMLALASCGSDDQPLTSGASSPPADAPSGEGEDRQPAPRALRADEVRARIAETDFYLPVYDGRPVPGEELNERQSAARSSLGLWKARHAGSRGAAVGVSDGRKGYLALQEELKLTDQEFESYLYDAGVEEAVVAGILDKTSPMAVADALFTEPAPICDGDGVVALYAHAGDPAQGSLQVYRSVTQIDPAALPSTVLAAWTVDDVAVAGGAGYAWQRFDTPEILTIASTTNSACELSDLAAEVTIQRSAR